MKLPTSSSSTSSRLIDITVFGCTGNAGRGVAFQLMRSALLSAKEQEKQSGNETLSKPALRIGLAGRNRSKLESTLQGLEQELTIENDRNLLDITVVVADAQDPASMTAMATASRVIISCAGPFGRYGEACVKACVEHGAHYLDITGEVDWVTDMINKYDDTAKTAGVTLLPFAGYDCVPSELAMILTNNALASLKDERKSSKAAPTMVLGELNLAFSGEGSGFPRGTLNTILDALEGTKGKESKKRNNSGETSKTNNFQRFYPKAYKATAKGPLSARNFLLPKWSQHVNQYTGPNFMASVNAPVLCRSAAAASSKSSAASSSIYTPLLISDRSIVSGPPKLLNGYGLFPTQLYISALVFSGIAFLFPPVRSWLRNKLTTYSFAGNPDGNVVVNAEGIPYKSSSSSSSPQGKDTSSTVRSTMRMVVPGDAGIYATGLFAVAVAETLLEVVRASSSGTGTRGNTKSLLPAGFHPPVVALHHATINASEDGNGVGLLVKNLCRLGTDIQLQLIDGSTNTNTVLDPTTMMHLQSKL